MVRIDVLSVLHVPKWIIISICDFACDDGWQNPTKFAELGRSTLFEL